MKLWVKSTKNGTYGSYTVTIPKEYIDILKWKKGDVLWCNVKNDHTIEIINARKYKE